MASGDTLGTWNAYGLQQPLSDVATRDMRNGKAVLDFDATSDEGAFIDDVLPASYAGGGLTLLIHFAGTSATSGDVVWTGAVERMQAGTDDDDADSYATAQTATVTTSGTSGSVTVGTITFSSGANMDSLAAGEGYRLLITRDANNASDTMSGDAEIRKVHLKET